MKYVVLLCDGMADEKVPQLNNKTPMQVAKKPNMDNLARYAELGLCKTVPDNMKPGSDIANLSVMGYNPQECYSGRSPLEAVSIGVDLKETDVTFRCNLVTLSEEEKYENKKMLDYCADDISTEEAKTLIDFLEENLGNDYFKFYSGIAYRHCLVLDCSEQMSIDNSFIKNLNYDLTPPHDITEKEIKNYIPKGININKIYDLMKKSYDLLSNHAVNVNRVKNGKKPANSIWLWGMGTKPSLDSFYNKYGKNGSVISAVDLLKGIAKCSGMNSVDVEGATGYIDTNFEGKVNAAINELKNGKDFVYIHIEAPDECGHRGEIDKKVKSLKLIDELVLAPLLDYLNTLNEFKLLILPDHPTPLGIKTHTSNPVPYLLYSNKNKINSKSTEFTEETAEKSGNFVEEGFRLMDKFLS